MKDKIVVIGSSNVDLIMKMDRLPEKGETITDASFFRFLGEKALIRRLELSVPAETQLL